MTRAHQIVAAAAAVSLLLLPVQISSAFGLPAHPLLVHAPVVLIPITCLAAFAVAAAYRHQLAVAAIAVIAQITTILAAGAGARFKEDREPELSPTQLDTVAEHEDAGYFLRWLVILLTLTLVATTFKLPRKAQLAARVLIGLFALLALIWVIRTGHLGSKAVWENA
jgi:hypothetical protein